MLKKLFQMSEVMFVQLWCVSEHSTEEEGWSCRNIGPSQTGYYCHLVVHMVRYPNLHI